MAGPVRRPALGDVQLDAAPDFGMLDADRVRYPTIDIVLPARDEVLTVAANVRAALGCRYGREVIVVDDGSCDGTGDEARLAGAKVVRVDRSSGSKAHAMAEGVAVSDADAILFVDADCTGLSSDHLDALCEPWLAGRCTMSLGVFDYGRAWNPIVRRLPPLTGERLVPRWVFEAVPVEKLLGYTIEVRINEVVAEHHGQSVVRTMDGVQHRTKRAKLGRRLGVLATLEMYRDLVAQFRPGEVRWRTYWYYLRGLTVEH
jgi:glycosyltransferase involved in cell wall biosynthesis